MYTDTHAHLYHGGLEKELDAVMERAEKAGVEKIVCVGTDLETSRKSITFSERYPGIFATVGIHPHDAKEAPGAYLDEIRDLAAHDGVVGIGETGLDFYRNLSPPEIQVEIFRGQLELADELDLPVIVHNRDADEALLRTIESVGQRKGVMHCFTGTFEMAEKSLVLGFKISFTGIITYGNETIESVVRGVPLESMMIETDSPFLSPVPVRRRRNEPAHVPYVASRIAEIKGESLETVAHATRETASRFFDLPG
ncbi:MAG: TatD family hydrolase [Candidatus Neomarinimicrobiota bacterium]